ncbi:MAG TPA: hypothetical protein VF574_12250 [Allosphingosinicella sp.]|jgi:hypothetical protein
MAKKSPPGDVPNLHVTIDLLALAAALERRGGKRKLAGALRNAWRAQSCVADLRQAEVICETLDQLTDGLPTFGLPLLLNIQSCLLSTAILLYARATSTGGSQGERGSVQLPPSKLTPRQREDHKTLVGIRNGALGHVQTDASLAGDFWHRDYLFAKRVQPGTWGVASGSTSIGLHFEAMAILRRQLPVALGIIAARSRERIDEAMQALDETHPSEATMLRHQVDPVTWFGSVETAQTMLAGGPGDESSTWLPLR